MDYNPNDVLDEHEYILFLKDSFKDIIGIWKSIGFDKKVVERRADYIKKCFFSYMKDIKTGEDSIFKDVIDDVKKYKGLVERLEIGLQIDTRKEYEHLKNKILTDSEFKCEMQSKKDLTLIQELKLYKALYDDLEQLKLKRKKAYDELKRKESELCEILDESELNSLNESTLLASDLQKLENHVKKLNEEREKRVNVLKTIWKEVDKIVDEYKIPIEPSSSLNQLNCMRLANFNELEFDLPLDYENISNIRQSFERYRDRKDQLIIVIDFLCKEIKTFWSKLKCINEPLEYLVEKPIYCEDLRLELLKEKDRCIRLRNSKLSEFIVELKDRVRELWDECLISEAERSLFEAFNVKVINENIYDEHEIYLAKLEEYKKKNAKIINLSRNWIETWNNYVDFEIKYSDPLRFSNRSYSSLFESKERTRLKKDLENLENCLVKETQFLMENESFEFKIYGKNVANFISDTKLLYQQEREKRKKQRLAKKELEIKKEAFYGVNSSPLNKVSTPLHITKSSNCESVGRAPRKTSIHNFNSTKYSINLKKEIKQTVFKNIAHEMSPIFQNKSPLAENLKVNMASVKVSLAPPVVSVISPSLSSLGKVQHSTVSLNLVKKNKSPTFTKSSPKKLSRPSSKSLGKHTDRVSDASSKAKRLSSAKVLKQKLTRRSRTGFKTIHSQAPQIILIDENGVRLDMSSVVGEGSNEHRNDVFSTLSSGIDSGMTSSLYTDRLVVNSSPIQKY